MHGDDRGDCGGGRGVRGGLRRLVHVLAPPHGVRLRAGARPGRPLGARGAARAEIPASDHGPGASRTGTQCRARTSRSQQHKFSRRRVATAVILMARLCSARNAVIMSTRWRIGLAAIIAAAIVGGFVPHGALVRHRRHIGHGDPGHPAGTDRRGLRCQGRSTCADATCGKGNTAPAAPSPGIALVAVVARPGRGRAAAACVRRRRAQHVCPPGRSARPAVPPAAVLLARPRSAATAAGCPIQGIGLTLRQRCAGQSGPAPAEVDIPGLRHDACPRRVRTPEPRPPVPTRASERAHPVARSAPIQGEHTHVEVPDGAVAPTAAGPATKAQRQATEPSRTRTRSARVDRPEPNRRPPGRASAPATRS